MLFRSKKPMMLPRFYPILDSETALRHGVKSADAAAQLLEAGARILQFRCKQFFSRAVLKELEIIAELCAQANATLVVNDRADIARIVGAALHVGQQDLTPAQARCVLGDQALIGYSTHNAAQLETARAEPADYLAIGPVFATATKENPDPELGLERLSTLSALTDRPLVAIGGITRANVRDVLAAGADSVAVIGDLYPELKSRAREFLQITGEL